MKWLLVFLILITIATTVLTQTPEIVVTNADIEIRFSGETDWVNGGDTAQTIFTVGPIIYSLEPMSTNVKTTTKLGEPETWEIEMFRVGTEPFRKAIFIITIHEATNRIFELRVANRYEGEDIIARSLPTEDKVIGKPEKPINTR